MYLLLLLSISLIFLETETAYRVMGCIDKR
nr:MAG TPA: hypothetical protein [Caudoviricetes sp.]DAY24162.1 MAG TPA: hypothetical protein [Caudoviricetes sp.]